MSNKLPKPEYGYDEYTGLYTCYGCGVSQQTEYIMHMGQPNGKKPVYVCEVCYKTHAGNSAVYPEQYEDRQTIKVIAQTTNLVLEEIRLAARATRLNAVYLQALYEIAGLDDVQRTAQELKAIAHKAYTAILNIEE